MNKKKVITGLLTMTLLSTSALTNIYAEDSYTSYNQKMREIGYYSTNEEPDTDGGVAEIIKYNKWNQKMYVISGKSTSVRIIDLSQIQSSTRKILQEEKRIDMKDLNINDAGDITSIDISPDGKEFALAVQHNNYDKNGWIVRLNDKGQLLSKTEAGVQPDMLTYTPDGKMILTANEGEPRLGYGENSIDPQGTITAFSLESQKSVNIDFTAFDSPEARKSLVDKHIILKKDTNPSVDFEPEYIAVSDKKAYITLQEANAIAVLDLNTKTILDIYSAGFEDYSKQAIDIDKKDEKYVAKTYDSLKGIRMPDGIAVYSVNGEDYVVTANEGDSREWGDYLNEDERNFKDGKTSPTGKITAENSGLTGKVVFFDTKDYDGLNEKNDYLFGGRSATLFKMENGALKEVYTTSNDFEKKTAELLPKYFNCSNDDTTIDDRSGKKGPEPEDVKTLKIDGKTYAFIGLERIGGVMMYDVTQPTQSVYHDYINLRDFQDDGNKTSVSPEGLCTISAQDSPSNKPLLLVANEVSGDVNVIELEGQSFTHQITLDQSSYTLEVGGTQKLNPKYTGYKTLTYTSNDEKIVSVDNQTLIGKAAGQATITISDGQVKTTCTVIVKAKETPQISPVSTNKKPQTSQSHNQKVQNTSTQLQTPSKQVKTSDSQNGFIYIILLISASCLFLYTKKHTKKS